MPELRYNPLLGTWTIVAPKRQGRPNLKTTGCPFCPGSGKVPGGYTVLAYDNDFPALSRESGFQPEAAVGPYRVRPAYGKCEVILYSPDHDASLWSLPPNHIRSLVDLWCARSEELSKDETIKYVFVFENRGSEVGVTIHHPHGQIYAYPFLPQKIEVELENSKRHYDMRGKCLICEMNDYERVSGARMVTESDDFLVYLPYFTDYPYGVFVVPKRHVTYISQLTSPERDDLSRVLKDVTGAFDCLFDRPFPYMMCVHQGPVNSPGWKGSDAFCHLHIEFYPPLRAKDRIKYYASSEMGAWAACNPLAVEDAVLDLREALSRFRSGEKKADPAAMPDLPSASPVESGQVTRIQKAFVETYGGPEEDVCVFFAPGRVNLIGDHTDYNGGLVLPAAISLGIYAAVRYTASSKDSERVFRARSLDAPGEACLRPAGLETEPGGSAASPVSSGSWTAYPEGIVRYLVKEGLPVPGCDVLYFSDLPIGAGLSSSAALELVTAYSLLHGTDVDRVWLADLCRRVENEFVGVQCGPMDQFIVAMGKKGCAILLDCQTGDWSYVPVETGEYSLIIMDSRKERSLATSAYNERRAQCVAAFDLIKRYKDISSLCQASLEDVRRYVDDPVLLKRARHVATERSRAKTAAGLLRQGKVAEFGALMVESHRSLRDDYEVTGPELDALVKAALQTKGCAGARMSGGGFGGCALALVRSDSLEAFKEQVSRVYRERAGMFPAFYLCEFGDGVGEVE